MVCGVHGCSLGALVHGGRGSFFGTLWGSGLFSGTVSIELDGSKGPFPEYEIRSDGEGLIGNIRAGGGLQVN